MSILALRLVLHQLRHEWLGATCLCIAMAAAIIPLLMILGLKEGTVATLRHRLASDPVNLEVRMPQTTRITQEEIHKVTQMPGVGFCVPCTRALATSAMLSPVSAPDTRQESYLVASATGDPLLSRYGCEAPQEGEIVISSGIAEKTGLKSGDIVQVEASCRDQGRIIRSSQNCTVTGILPSESGAGMQSFVPLSLVIGVEEFIEGLRNGIGQNAGGVIPQAVFHGFWLDKPEAIQAMRAGMWAMACPFREQRDPDELELAAGKAAPGSRLFFNTSQFVQPDKLRQAYSLTRQQQASLALWNPPLQVTLQTPEALSPCTVDAEPTPLKFGVQPETAYTALSSDPNQAGDHIILLNGGSSSAPLNIRYHADIPAGELRVSAQLLGILHQICYRNLWWNSEYKRFEQKNRTFSRMRLYAAGLDDVEPLVNKLESMGYQAVGNIAGIRRVQDLNTQLKVLFGLIACIGIAGAACSLALTLFNNVLKRRREYAILCTLGITRLKLFLFPVYEAIILILSSLALSFGLFHFMSYAVARLFASDIGQGESLCYLSPQLHLAITGTGLLMGLVAAMCAAITILKFQPSTAIREL